MYKAILDTSVLIDIIKCQRPNNLYELLFNSVSTRFYISHVQEDEITDQIQKNQLLELIENGKLTKIPVPLWVLGYGRLDHIRLGTDDVHDIYKNSLSYMRNKATTDQYLSRTLQKLRRRELKIWKSERKINGTNLYLKQEHEKFTLIFRDDKYDEIYINLYFDDNKLILYSENNRIYVQITLDSVFDIFSIAEVQDVLHNKLPIKDAIKIGLCDYFVRDAIIATTAYANNMILITNDILLKDTAINFGIHTYGADDVIEIILE